ncbi:MAG TPA: hypothetical protein ENI50_02555, partial [Euryarchaeota archaeon]|nr:hypothetical protein [Euryarchaeota archaeon]
MIRYTMFLRRRSILHSIDPRSKIILSLFLFTVCIFFNDPIYIGIIFFFLIISLKIFGKIEIKKTLSFLKPMLPFVVMIMLLWILLGSEKGNVIYQIWKLKIKDVNIEMAIAMGFRVLA